jgi:PhnB protein
MIHELFAYLRVSDAKAAIDFYSRVFEAREIFRLSEPSGRIGHAELDFNGTTVMLSDAFPEASLYSASQIGDTPVALHLHVDNADALIEHAVSQGAILEMAPQDHFYGERSGRIKDPFGHCWLIGHSIETLSHAEMQQRYNRLFESPTD